MPIGLGCLVKHCFILIKQSRTLQLLFTCFNYKESSRIAVPGYKKNNLINTCLDAYLSRIENLFYIIRYSSSDVLSCLWEISLAYMDNLYKGECAFWLDINRYLEYKYIYTAHNRMWRDGLGKVISACQQEDYVVPDLDIQMFLESFTTLLYNARIAECPPIVLHKSAYFMLRGIMTSQGSERLEKIENQFAESMKK